MGNFDLGFRVNTAQRPQYTGVWQGGNNAQRNATAQLYGNVGQMFQQGTKAIQQGVTAGSEAMNAAQQADLASRLSVSEARSSAGEARMNARDMVGIAGQVQKSADRMGQFIAPVAEAGARLSDDANKMREGADNILGMHRDLMSGDTAADGLLGEWNRFVASVSPDAYVSMAKRTAQSTVDNQREQIVRAMSRMGVAPGSQAMAAALSKAKRYDEALVSGTVQRARQAGLEMQGSVLEKGLNLALQTSKMWSDLTAQSASIDATGAGLTKAASEIEAMKGNLTASTASIMQAAGQLVLGSGGMSLSAGEMSQRQASLIAQAAQVVINAQTTAAEYYSTQSSSILGMLQRGVNIQPLGALFG